MDTLPLPCARSFIFRRPILLLPAVFIAFTSIHSTHAALPQRVGQESGSRWTIEDCFKSDRNYDVTFVIDSAVSWEALRNVQRFVNDVIKRLNLQQSRAKIGFMTFSTILQSMTFKKRWRHHGELRDAINALKPNVNGKFNIGKALNAAAQTVNPKSTARSIVVLIVGSEAIGSAVRGSKYLHRRGARTITVGYDSADDTQLRWAASKPLRENMIHLETSEDLIMATDTILSIVCEEVLNGNPRQSVGYPLKKKSSPEKSVHLHGHRSIVSSPESVQIRWNENSSPILLKYRITWVPKEGQLELLVNETSSGLRLYNLNPATIYKVRISPVTKKNYGKPLSLIVATKPLPVTNLTARIAYTEPCTLQKRLQRQHKARLGVSLRPDDCEKNKTVIFVGWNKSQNSKFYMMRLNPKAGKLVRVTRRSTRQYLTNVKDGEDYTLSVTTRGPRLLQSVPESITVIIPPSDPVRLDSAVVNSTTVALRWQVARDTIFDTFNIAVVSAFGKITYRFPTPYPANVSADEPRPFYTHLLEELRPDTDYLVTVYTESKNVSSRGDMVTAFSTKTNKDLYNVPFLIISGGDGIYAATATKGMGTDSIQKLFPVTGGVVNAIYHSRWIRPQEQIQAYDTGSFRWQKLLIWIERHTRSIKVTDLTSQSTTVTLVSGLLQPVALKIDPYGENIYWSDIGSRSIGVASIALEPGSRPYQVNRNLVTGDLETPVSLAINVVDRYIFWGDLQGQIERGNMDGSHRMVLLKRPTMQPYSMTFCERSKRLYWIDASTGNLESMMSSGSEYEVTYSQAMSPGMKLSSLVVAQQYFYWFDKESKIVVGLAKNFTEGRVPEPIYEESQVPLLTSMTSFDPVGLEKGSTYGFTTMDRLMSLMMDSDDLSFPCHRTTFSCIGVCIPVTMKEATCSNDCKPWEMMCYRSPEVTCIGQHLTCDGKSDCAGGEDEDLPECERQLEEELCESENMTAYGCRDSGRCIPFELVCDGFLNCKDGSDEADCPLQEQKCDFELDGTCLWVQEREDDDFDWMLQHRKTDSNDTGPLMDHTKDKINGSYMYLEATSQDEGSKARLNSVLFAKPLCISFYYYMHGETMGSLSLYLRDQKSGHVEELWSKSGNQGVGWNQAKVSVNRHQLYQLMIEGVRGEDYRSDIAIDDIIIRDGQCQVSPQCDFYNFDDLMCGYHIGKTWKQVSGPIAPPGSKPVSDLDRKPMQQDLSNIIGPNWFYFDFKSDDFPGCSECNGARIVRDISNSVYAEDGVNYVGVVLCDENKYKIYLSDTLSGSFKNIADGAGKGEDHCEFIGASDYATDVGNYKECEGDAGYVRRKWGEMIEVESYGFYRSTFFAPSSYSCDYSFPQYVIENDPVLWQKSLPNSYLHLDLEDLQDDGDDAPSITIPVGLTKVKKVGDVREGDNSTENTRTLFLSTFVTAAPAPDLNLTKIESEDKHPKSWCLKFRYFIIGSDSHSLHVSVNNEYYIWTKNGEQGQEWKNATIDLPYPSMKYDLSITATRGEGFNGSLGIDDVTIIHEPCHPKLNYRCDLNVPITEECAFVAVGDIYEQVKLDPLYNRSEFDPNIVEDFNYASGVLTSTYIGLSNGTTITSHPILRSPVLPSLSSYYPVLCLTVKYRQRSDEGSVSVVIRSAATDEVHTLSSHLLPAQKSLIRPWLTYIAQVTEASSHIVKDDNFYIEYHGLNSTWVNELTLDTVECSAVVEDLCSNSVRCSNGDCVAPQLLCDGINDCGDWSDEIGCPSQCGDVADYFNTKAFFDGTQSLQSDVCVHRIHGQPGKQTLLTVGEISDAAVADHHIVMKVYEGFMQRHSGTLEPGHGFYPNGSLVLTTSDFSKKTAYLIRSHNVTIVVEYSSQSLAPVPLSYEMVEEDHCSLVCPNHHCLFNNRRCDGNPGCSDGSDEKNCTRVVSNDGVKVLEVQHLDGPFAPVCGDDITPRLADAVCRQLGELHAERPLNKTPLPPSYDGVVPHKLTAVKEITENSLLQGFIAVNKNREHMIRNASLQSGPKRKVARCMSRETWVPNCISYQCGVRPIDINPFDSSGPPLNPILRIIGGGKSKKGRWPWIASLLLKERDHNCGATLISDRFVITAAHCFDEHSPTSFTVLLGANAIKNYGPEATKHAIKRGIIHRSYNKQEDIPDWDIALVELEEPVRFSTYKSPVCLPEGDMKFPPGTECFIAGFGHISEGRGSQNMLHEAKTPVISNSECDSGMYLGAITERMLCAGFPHIGGVGICHGDSGGPLVCQHDGKGPWFLVGVASWSIGCANRGKPDVFTRILSHVAWINEQTGFNLTVPAQKRPVVGTCGGTYYGESAGAFASPGWPKNYKDDQNCVYKILADMGQTIHLSFDEFATEMYFDVVEIYAGEISTSSKLKAPQSGTKKPEPISARASAMIIIFKSDADTNERGFLARWRISGAQTPYSGPAHPIRIQLQSSTNVKRFPRHLLGFFFFFEIGPGGWPMFKQHSDDKEFSEMRYLPQSGRWMIRSKKPGDESKLRVDCIKSTPDLCSETWELWNGTDWVEVKLKISLVIGMKAPRSTKPPTTAATTTPGPAPTIGQEATAPTNFYRECGNHVLTTLEGTISSPGYGSRNYANNLDCRWYIKSPPTRGNERSWILLEIVSINTQEDHDYLWGYAGNSTTSSPLFGLSGDGFHMDDDDSFNLDIAPLSPGVETREEVEESWFALFGGFGLPAVTTTKTTTTQRAPTRKLTAVMRFEDADSEGMTLSFKTDGSVTDKGFLIRYYVVGDLNDSPLTSSEYVTIDITEDESLGEGLLTRRKRNLLSDLWTLSDDGSADYEVIYGSGDDFNYNYYYPNFAEFVSPDCNHTMEVNGTTLINYTATFEQQETEAYCIWRLKTISPLQLLQLDLTFDAYAGSSSVYYFSILNKLLYTEFILDEVPESEMQKSLKSLEYAEIHFRTNIKKIGFSAEVKSYKVQTTPPAFASPTSSGTTTASLIKPATTVVSVTTPRPKQGLRVTSNCEDVINNIESDKIAITSPLFPDEYPGFSDCTWVIKVPSTQKIAITFTHIDIEEVDSECSYDNVTIIDGDVDSQPNTVFCGMELPHQIVSSGSVMMVKFASDKLVQAGGFRAIISAIKHKRLKSKNQSVLFACDFDDEDICGFTHDKSADVEFSWTKHYSVTASENTGPPHDASESGDGYYLFIEASIPRQAGDRARLVSPVLESAPGKAKCLNFSYSMKGLSVGSLVVYISIASDGSSGLPMEEDVDLETQSLREEARRENMYNLRPIVLNFGAGLNQDRMTPTYRNSSGKPSWQQFLLWSRTGEQDHEEEPWLTAEVTFTPNNHFQLLFEGLRGSEYQSDIAIDNIMLREGECKRTECNFETEVSCGSFENKKEIVCIPRKLVCDGHQDCENGSDEEDCSSPLGQVCDRSAPLTRNTTDWMICNNMEKCSTPKVNIGRVGEIACDGTNDCFGGYDESFCDVMNGRKGKADNSNQNCGKQAVKDEHTMKRSKTHTIQPEAMPWVSGLYLEIDPDVSGHVPEDSEPSIENRYLFLCSAVFIRDSWLLAPAHCILDPEMTRKDLADFLHNRKATKSKIENPKQIAVGPSPKVEIENQKWNDVPWLSDFNPVEEFKGLYPEHSVPDEVIDLSETTFDYYIITRSSEGSEGSQGKPTYHRVSKLIPHPNYAMLKHLDIQDCNITANADIVEGDEKQPPKMSSNGIRCDINRINHDVTLIKLEDTVSYNPRSEYDEAKTQEFKSNPACLNKMSSQSLWQHGTVYSGKSSQKNNIFFPPSEKVVYGLNYRKRSVCYAVGHSPVKTEEDSKTELVLSRKSVQLVSGDVSAPRLVCGMQSKFKSDPECLKLFKEGGPEEDLNHLLVSGYLGEKEASFLYDQGSVIMCKGWDKRWYLTGLYSWNNMYKNLQHERLYEPRKDEDAVTGGFLQHSAILGHPLGMDTYIDVSHISEWIQDTLREDCPGEFPCYDESSSLPQKCIPKQKLCDGVIDCPVNYLDEINCASGCSYDLDVDPFWLYYQNLEDNGVALPEDVVSEYDLTGGNNSLTGKFVEMGDKNPKSIIVDSRDYYNLLNLTDVKMNEKSWRGGVSEGRIRANKPKNQKIKMCIWTIKAPEDRVSVIHFDKFNTIPDGNRIQIVSNGEGQGELLRDSTKDIFFTSKPGAALTIRLLPPNDQLYLTDIRHFEATHYTEAVGACSDRHKCGDGTCVSPHRVCDGIWDCADRSDEKECTSGCGGKAFISGPSSGVIMSKNYPFRHSGRGDCEWQLVAKPNGGNSKFVFEFMDFTTDDDDILFLFKGAGIRKSGENLLAVYSGDKGSFNETIEAQSVTLLLRSNDHIAKRKFRIRYTVRNPV